MSEDEKEEIIEELEEQETTQVAEEEEEVTEETTEPETLEAESTEEEAEEEIEETPEEEISTITTDEIIEEEEIPELEAVEEVLEIPDVPEEMPEEPIEIIAEEVEEAEIEELEIPEVPIEAKADEITDDLEVVIEDDDLDAEEVEVEKPIKPKKKRTNFGLSIIVSLAVSLGIIVAFSIPLWLQGTSRPDLYYIELVLVLVALMIPGLITRSFQKGILGGFIVFIVSFGLPTVLAVFVDIQILSNPLAPLFASTDFALPALAVFIDLFPDLGDLPFAQIQVWIWIVDLVIMFIIVLLVIVFGTWLLKNITKPKKKAGNWVAIPLLSIGLIIFAVFTPIIFSSTYGIVQASTSFLAGATKMQDAYGSFEGGDLQTLELGPINDSLTEANIWLDISQANYQGLKNIGIISIASLAAGKYAPLIQAGDQLALATLALTNVLYPLFSGIFDLTQSLKNATDDMADFGQEQGTIPADLKSILFTTMDITSIEDLKSSLEEAISTLESARDTLISVEEKISEADITGAFDEVQSTLEDLDTADFPDAIAAIIEEIKDKLGSFDGQLTGFVEFISFSADNIDPTIHILWTCYNSIEGNDHIRNYRFSEAKSSFQQAIGNISAISLTSFTPPPELGGIFSIDITEDFSLLLEDLLGLLDPLLHEEYAFASTYDTIFDIVSILNTEDLTQLLTYTLVNPLIIEADNTAAQTLANGTIAETELLSFRVNIATSAYGTAFSDIGANFDTLLTENFKPEQFGELTNNMTDVYSDLVESLRQYYLIVDLDTARTNIANAETMITDMVTGPTIDVDYIDNYFGNWSIIIANIKAKMDIGFGQDILTEITFLYTAIEAKIS
ncbi:MAG: multidrug efflux MFS transporter [Asgard group archaeon]|nr:multidrug efflux MFS transporter [Asgard group archaeon]